VKNWWGDFELSREARSVKRYRDGWEKIWGKKCCICGEQCEENPETREDQWHWGPDGMHCHYKCEAEFRRRYISTGAP
jgi:hypothetical protein